MHIKGTKYHLNKEFLRKEKYDELVQLATFLLTDGGMTKHKNTYILYFTNKSERLLQQFKLIVRELIPEVFFGINIHKGVTRISFYSIDLAELLFEFSNTFRTAPCESHPKCALLRGTPEQRPCSVCIKRYDKENKTYPNATLPIVDDEILQREILRIVADTEGGTSFLVRRKPNHILLQRSVRISCNHPTLREQIIEMLFDLGILNRYSSGNIVIEGHAIELFNEIVGFSRGVKVSRGIYKGYDKQSVLEVMILTNKLIKDKRVYPGQIKNLENVLEKIIQIYDQTYSRMKVIDYLTNC